MTTNKKIENLGPAERIIKSVLEYTDHMFHHRPGVVYPDKRTNIGVRWEFCTHRTQDVDGRPEKVVFKIDTVGKKKVETRVGVMRAVPIEEPPHDGRRVVALPLRTRIAVVEGGREVAEYRKPGMFPEVAVWMYKQIVEVWKLDNEFAARWASFAFGQEHRDLKVALAALMLVQNRRGDIVRDGESGKVAFFDEDYRDVGEAMSLIRRKDDHDLNAKQLLRIHTLLTLPGVAAINRELGFANSPRKPPLGRWPTVITKWLRHREENPKLLDGLVRAGLKSTVTRLVQLTHFTPASPKFFETLGWKQAQSADGRRTMAIGVAVEGHSLEGKTETEICEYIVKERPNWKRLVGMLPKNVGITRAIVAAAIESKAMSDADLLIATPTLEELGLLTEVPEIRARWEKATKTAENMRANNIAKRVQNKELKEKLADAADTALKKAVEQAVKGLRVYWLVDISGSMEKSIEKAKKYLTQTLPGFPLDQIHVAAFNQTGRIVTIKHASAAGVENAFRGIAASGGTSHGAGIRALAEFKPKDDEDSLFIFVGDEGESGAHTFEADVKASGLRPTAFGLIKVPGDPGNWIQQTAAKLGIPCFMIEEQTFADVAAIPRTIRALVASTPVGAPVAGRVAAPRVTLVEQILKTDLLTKPVWA